MNTYFIIIGLISSILYAISIVIKKGIFSKTNLPSYIFSLIQTFISACFALIIILIFNIDIFTNAYFIGLLFFAGFLYGISLLFYYYALEKDNATRVSQLCSLEVIIVPISAIIILQETPTLESIIGSLLIIVSILYLSIDEEILDILNIAKYALIPILICLVLWTAEDLIMKYTLSYVDFLVVYFWVRISSFISLLVSFGLIKNTHKNVLKLHTQLPKKELILFFIASIITSLGLLFAVLTYSLGPLSIASPIVSSYPIFVSIISYISYRIFKQESVQISFLKQFISSILFLLGIILIQYSAI